MSFFQKILLLHALTLLSVYVLQGAEIKNDFIHIVVSGEGRFSAGTVGGDPDNPNDNDKKLIYGHPSPGTSFTTVKVGGVNYKFGSAGTLTKAPVDSKTKIECAWTFDGVTVTQILSFFKGYSTGRMDSMKMEYKAVNTGAVAKDVGIRIMIDTMLGDNDAAPFRILGFGGVTTIRTFDNDSLTAFPDIPQYWQAFDSLSLPNVQAQGTLSGGVATKPDRFMTASWGGVTGTDWDYSGSSNTSTGDSAIVIYWDPKSLAPGGERSYVSLYGLGGITFVKWDPFNIGVSASEFLEIIDAKITPDPFTVVAYIENFSGASVSGAKAKIVPGRGTYLSPEDTAEKNIESAPNTGSIGASGIAQLEWKLKPRGSYMGYVEFYVDVTYNGGLKRVTRKIYIPGLANSLFGLVTDLSENPLPSGGLFLSRGGVQTATTTVYSDGTFLFQNLADETCTLKAVCPGYLTRIIDTHPATDPALAKNNYIALSPASAAVSQDTVKTYPYPNPVSSNYSRITYFMSGAGSAKISIFTSGGELLRTFERASDGQGYYSVDWDIAGIPNGVYLYTIDATDGGVSKKGYNKIVIVKGVLK